MRDLAISRPASPGRARPRKRQGVFARLRGFRHWGAVRRYGTRAVLWPGFAALMAVIVLNATAFQTGHHPAPLVPVASEPAVPAPQSRVALDDDAQPAAAPRAPAAPAAAVVEPAPVPPRPDGIAQVLRPAARQAAAHEAKPARERLAKAAEQPKPGASAPKALDRQRLAAMMGAASKGRALATTAN